jgi:ABC-2 type transport system permease protein
MADRIFSWLGIDRIQWHALVVAYLRMDGRRAGGAARPGERPGRHAFGAYSGLILMTSISSIFLAIAAVVLEDSLTVAVVLTTYAAMNTSMLLLLDFTGLVVSPDDYRILASRPVDSRTYLAARLTSVLVYVAMIAGVLALAPSLVLGIWHGLGVIGFLSALLATVLCCVCAAVIVIVAYAKLVSFVHPRRLSRALSYLQLTASTTFIASYYLVAQVSQSAHLRHLSMRHFRWLWSLPSTWFASLVPVAGGLAGPAEWTGSAAAIACVAFCVPLAAGRLSLDYAERLSEIAAMSEPPARQRRILPGFRTAEAFAIATLVRAQFRYDPRFRLAILGVLPITAFYMMLGVNNGTMTDPFVEGWENFASPMYFAVAFLPMTLHGSLLYSDSWRSAWIFFATPADPAKLIISAKNFVAIFFLGAYIVLIAIVWSFYFERVWHALVHAAFVGVLAHFLLQGAVIIHPALPFAAEPRKAERSSQVMGLFFVASIASGIAPFLLALFYRRLAATVILAIVLIALTIGLERIVRRRARNAGLGMEFRS